MLKDLFPNARPWQRGGLRLLAFLAGAGLWMLEADALAASQWFAATSYGLVGTMLLIVALVPSRPSADYMPGAWKPADDGQGSEASKQADDAVKAFASALINQSRNPFGYPELNCTIRAMRCELANRLGADVAEIMMGKKPR